MGDAQKSSTALVRRLCFFGEGSQSFIKIVMQKIFLRSKKEDVGLSARNGAPGPNRTVIAGLGNLCYIQLSYRG